MSFMSNHAIHDFSRNSVKSGGEGRAGEGVKKVFLSLRRQKYLSAPPRGRLISIRWNGAKKYKETTEHIWQH
jgi:hypothetical protein